MGGITTTSLDKPQRKRQSSTQPPLPPRHFAGVVFVVVSGQVQQSVQHQDLDLGPQGVALLHRLSPRRLHTDGKVAGNLAARHLGRRKAQHIGGLVLASKAPVQPPDSRIGGQQHRYQAAQPHRLLRQAQKAIQRARTGQASIS